MKFKTVFLHVGHDKTGSTALQSTLFTNRKLLESWGVAYGGGSIYEAEMQRKRQTIFHNDELLYAHFSKQEGGASEITSAYLEALELRSGEGETPFLVLSFEGLFHLRAEAVRALHQWLCSIAEKIVVIVYVRTPLGFAISGLSQRVKTGRRLLGHLPYKKYNEHLKTWISVFGKKRVVVRDFRRDSDVRFDICEDFFNASVLTCVPEASLSLLKKPEIAGNPGLSGMGMRTGDRIIELLGDSCPREGWQFRELFSTHLAALDPEPFSITAPQLQRLKDECREQLAYLAREFDVYFERDPFLVEPASPCSESEVEAAARRIIKEVLPSHKVKRNLLKRLKRKIFPSRGPFFKAAR